MIYMNNSLSILALFIAVSALTISLINYKALNEIEHNVDYVIKYPVSEMTFKCFDVKTNKQVDCED